MPRLRVAGLVALLAGGLPLVAGADEFRADLIARYESAGGRNVPNYLYDGPHGRHTAGGPCQMTDTNWRRIAPTIDIDIEKFPNAGSAPEHEQWQACFKLAALDGYNPWACCNVKLRKALAGNPSPPAREDVPRKKTELALPSTVPSNPFLRPARIMPEMVFNTAERK